MLALWLPLWFASVSRAASSSSSLSVRRLTLLLCPCWFFLAQRLAHLVSSRHACSWGSGANPWGPEKDDQFSKPTHYDGMLEVVGVTGVVHMGQIQSGLRSAIRIAQGGHVSLTYSLVELCCYCAASLKNVCVPIDRLKFE